MFQSPRNLNNLNIKAKVSESSLAQKPVIKKKKEEQQEINKQQEELNDEELGGKKFDPIILNDINSKILSSQQPI